MRVSYGTQTIEFKVERTQIKNTYITVERDSGVLIKAPESINNEKIKNLVKAKAFWISSKLEELGKAIDYGEVTTGSRIFYLGKSYYVSLITENRQNIEIVFIHSKFKIYTPKKVSQLELNNAIDNFYKQKAQTKITKLVKKYSDIMQLVPEYVGFRKSKTKWASCSEHNRITFNPELMKLSISLIEYTIVHELAHIAYKNHSKDFWRLVKKYMSDYLKKEQMLRIFEKKL
ncbi:MAG: M48 family metallopeptidase [Bacteroidales bacterium]|nr:M48 family metallopeptidase [Bacteroidales bacterium]